jgi:hypothetical protein
VEVIDDATPTPAQHTFAVSIIDHQQVPGLLGYPVQVRQRRDVAVHAEYAISDNKCSPRDRGLLNNSVQPLRIAVWVTGDLST